MCHSDGPAHRLLRPPVDPLPPEQIRHEEPCSTVAQVLEFEAAARASIWQQHCYDGARATLAALCADARAAPRLPRIALGALNYALAASADKGGHGIGHLEPRRIKQASPKGNTHLIEVLRSIEEHCTLHFPAVGCRKTSGGKRPIALLGQMHAPVLR
eukprot:4862099-Pyramimonas_sp.AAC.1